MDIKNLADQELIAQLENGLDAGYIDLEFLYENHLCFIQYNPAKFFQAVLYAGYKIFNSQSATYVADENLLLIRKELFKLILENRIDINIQNEQDQTPLFFAWDVEAIEFLISNGADLYIKDKQGNYWISSLPIELLEYVIKNNLISTDQANQEAYQALIKGDYERAFLCSQISFNIETNPVNILVEAIINGLECSIEVNKYQALINLAHRVGIEIPTQFEYLLHSYRDDYDKSKFNFLYAILHKLAKHYLELSKIELFRSINQETDAENELNIAFKTFNFDPLKLLFPNNRELSKMNSKFDSYFQTVGRALNILDNDFTLEVLTINGLRPDKLENDIIVYRGISKNLSPDIIDLTFKYGHRAPAQGNNQKFLGFYIENPWNDSGGRYEYGGTYVTLSPAIGSIYASGGLLLEIRAPIHSFKLCGMVTYYKENIINYVKGEDIIAIYSMNSTIINKVYKNPYLNDSYIPSLHAHQSNFDSNWQNAYDSLGCENITFLAPSDSRKRFGIYKDQSDFMQRYTPENYASDKQQLTLDYFNSRKLYVEDLSYEIQGECNLEIECCKF